MALEFYEWLKAVERIAMSSEWVIEPDELYWRPLYKKGMTPEAAVEHLFTEVRDRSEHKSVRVTRESLAAAYTRAFGAHGPDPVSERIAFKVMADFLGLAPAAAENARTA